MPGARLTHEERRRIADGLAEGLGYAEIARRLARPTSTISREVGRNGGPDGYRADPAQKATGERARRVRKTEPEPAAVRAFEEEFAAMMVRTGLPRMPARVLAGLLSSEHGALTAAELVHRLQVSPASVSKAVTYLEGIRLLRREKSGRRELYSTDDDVWFEACVGVTQVCEVWAGSARRGAALFGGTPAGRRLDEVGRYFECVGADMNEAAERWRQVFTARRTSGNLLSRAQDDPRPGLRT
ncbi:helix-turn-helix domain-containing protein [Nonomuraea spiralis]|uniref:Helix-turn-helix domain-containing protein n=1 Tax=Nonomuraea spiralis TaxID=46182 RepID=A0ABV5IKD5_9ACTN|nr:helix-turn-helix domain-containing protein [Nonomuraea spiralis]GGT19694.1 MarR family transcriptional regulator [Nonomuraea spiralis]